MAEWDDRKCKCMADTTRANGVAVMISCLFFTATTLSLRPAVGLICCWLMWRVATPNQNVSNVTGNVQHISDA